MKKILGKSSFKEENTLKRIFLILMFVLLIMGLFELLILVEGSRRMFPENLEGYSCKAVLDSRPWYGKINLWLGFWFILTPVIILLFKQNLPVWKKLAYVIFAILFSYIVLFIAVHMGMVIRNAPFHGNGIVHFNGVLESTEADVFKHNCFDIADGGKYVGAILFGWIPASIYVGFWLLVRWIYNISKRNNL